eukprot:CAMPEP_0184694782 /NCGR_PEP_ID=MMETSP0313-20130426/2628_1 /TAXON_ID=2792 /ORGANISM="Porphyridium aerugineum, Strain SAG 1380-2" /LENGTH=463 /DNA_ID=CAMNT_0027153129 /DNA_START=52 /DNA_END=1443 /DNA_ORIENTATION=+
MGKILMGTAGSRSNSARKEAKVKTKVVDEPHVDVESDGEERKQVHVEKQASKQTPKKTPKKQHDNVELVEKVKTPKSKAKNEHNAEADVVIDDAKLQSEKKRKHDVDNHDDDHDEGKAKGKSKKKEAGSIPLSSADSESRLKKALDALIKHEGQVVVKKAQNKAILGTDDGDDDGFDSDDDKQRKNKKSKTSKKALPLDDNDGPQVNEQQLSLLMNSTPVWLMMSLNTIPNSPAHHPFLISLPHAPFPAIMDLCLLVKDPQRTAKDACLKIKEENVKEKRKNALAKEGQFGYGVERVLAVSKLKQRYKTFESKRELCASHTRFIADVAITPMLPKLLGKAFYSSKKVPVVTNLAHLTNPADAKSSDLLKSYLTTVQTSTTLDLTSARGNCVSIRVGHLGLGKDKLFENVNAIMSWIKTSKAAAGGDEFKGGKEIADKLLKKDFWESITGMSIKTEKSPALPFQ